MARFRRGMRSPINRIKHVVDSSGTLTAGTPIVQSLAKSDDAPVLANTTECLTGSVVNGIYLHLEAVPNETDAGAIPNVYMMVMKNPGANLTFPSPNAVGADDNKRYVIHQEMIMLNNLAGGNPRSVFNGVIVIPKGYRRMGPGDALQISVFSTAVNIAFCYQAHYKEFR